MAKTLYTSGGFVLSNDESKIRRVSKSKSSFKEDSGNFIAIDEVTRERIIIPIADAVEWEDAETGGSAFTEATMRTFFEENFSTASGGSGAVDNSVVYPIYSSGAPASTGVDYWKRPPAKFYHFGHNWRFCGLTGGYTDGTGYFDVNGAATTKVLAFPEGVVLDLGRVDALGNFLAWQINPILFANSSKATAVTNCEGFSTDTFTTGWKMPTIIELFTLWYQPNTDALQQRPFESVTANLWIWSETPTAAGGSSHILRSMTIQTIPDMLTSSARAFPVRLTNISEI